MTLLDILAGVVVTLLSTAVLALLSSRFRIALRVFALSWRIANLDGDCVEMTRKTSFENLRFRLRLTDEQVDFLRSTELLSLDDLYEWDLGSLRRLLELSPDDLEAVSSLQGVKLSRYSAEGGRIINEAFYEEFGSRVERMVDLAIIVGEGVVADRGEEQRAMEKLVEGQRVATRREHTIIRVQTRPFLSEWWREVLEQLLIHGRRGGSKYFKLYFGPPQFIYSAVIDASHDSSACAEMMMPIGKGGQDLATGDEVERAGHGVFISGESRQALFLQRKILRFLDQAMSVEDFCQLAAPLVAERRADATRALRPQERALVHSFIRVEDEGELARLCEAFDIFKRGEHFDESRR